MLDLSDVHKFYDYKEQHRQISGKVYVGCQLIDGVDINIKKLQDICREIMTIHKQLCVQVTDTHKAYSLDITQLNFNDFVLISKEYDNINDRSFVEYLLKDPPDNGKSNTPLWRLIYFEKMNYLVFNFGHCFLDGMSAVIFLNLVLDRLSNKPLAPLDYSKFQKYVSDKLLLQYGIVDLYPRPNYSILDKLQVLKNECFEVMIEPFIFKLIKAYPKLLEYKFFRRYNRLYDSGVSPESCKYVDSFHCMNISSSDTKKLIKISKLLNTTLNSLLLALLSISSPKINKDYPINAKFNIPINMRPHLLKGDMAGPGANLIALAISSTQITTPSFKLESFLKKDSLDMSEFRKFIGDLDPPIKTGIAESISMDTYSIASFYKHDLDRLVAERPSIDFELSNLGLFMHPLVKDVCFNQGLEPMNYMNISAIGGVNGTNISFMWYSSIHDYSKQRVATFEKLVDILIKQNIDNI